VIKVFYKHIDLFNSTNLHRVNNYYFEHEILNILIKVFEGCEKWRDNYFNFILFFSYQLV
jgi:hypothetical protein